MTITTMQEAAVALTFTRTAQCSFASGPQEYTYKVPEGLAIAPLDEAIVDSPKGPVVVRVVSVNGPERVDPHVKFEYKWILQILDRTGDKLRKEASEFIKGPAVELKIVDGQVVGG